MTLINHRGVGCEVDKNDLMSIEEDQWITDGVLDFHNVLLSIRKPTLRDGKTWAALDCKAYFQTNTCGAPLTLGNGLPLLEHDYLAIPGVTPHQYRREMRRDLCAHASGDLIHQLEALGIEIPPQDEGRVTEGGAVVRERNAGTEDVRHAPVTQAEDDARVTEMMREMATLKNDVRYLDASFTVIANFVGLRRDEVVSAATQLQMQGNPVRPGANAEAGGTKNAPPTPQCPFGRKRRDDSSPEEDGVRNATRVALASSFAACDPTARLLQNPLLTGGTIPHWMFTRGRPLLEVTVPAGADAWGDTRGHETVKAEEEEDLVSDTEDEEDGENTCATKYTGVKLEKASGKYGVKILIKEGGKRKQQRLGAYTLEEEAAFAYAADDGTGAESASSSERNEEDGEADSDTSASGSPEESDEPATGGKTGDDGCAGTASPKADGRESRGARETDVFRGEGRGHVDGHVDRTCGTPVDTDGDDVRISSRVLEQLIRAQDKSAKENARLEALFLNAMARPSGGSRKRKAQKQRDPEQGCMNPKRQRGETWSGVSDDDGEDDEEDTHGSTGRHMSTAKSPILQRALAHMPTHKAWKRVCELARVHMFLNRPTSTMTFYPSSDDKTHGVCAVLDRLPHNFACLALAADKSRRADLNKTLSEWKTRAAARVRDIALPKLGLFRDDRDASSPWAPEKERSIEKIRERIGLGADPPGECRRRALESLTVCSHAPMRELWTLILTVRMWCAETLVLTSWAHDRDGMPFASRAFTTCAKAAFKPKKAGLVMTLKVYHLAWLEHAVSDCVLYWEERKGRLSNSAGGNAHVVDGLKVLVKEAVERAIRIRNPEYDAEREAWIWGRHGLRISACGLEHMRPMATAQSEGIVGDDDLSASLGAE
ncbi:unnamed protein product [Closterium sp. Naga37s-1]|nr:unnamed protein product [Closterium sp. Naga37s-1]